MANLQTLVINDEFLRLPIGTTGQRPNNNAGYLRYNTSNNRVEGNNGSSWQNQGFVPIQATGGIVSTITVNGIQYRQHQFNNATGTFSVIDAGSDGIVDFILEMDGSTNSSYDGIILREITRNKQLFSYTSTNPNSANAGRGVNNVEGESDPCSGSQTFENALRYAHDRGARLPTWEEMLNDVTEGSGCGYDNDPNWLASTASDTRHRISVGRDPSERASLTSGDNNSDTAVLRFVADNDSNRSDPNILHDPFMYEFLINNGYSASVEIVDPPTVQSGVSYNMSLGGTPAIPNTGPVDSGTGERGSGRIKVRYPLETPLL